MFLVGKVAVVVNIVAPSELLQGKFSLKGALQSELLGPHDLRNIYAGTGHVLTWRQEDHSLDFALALAKLGTYTANQGRIIDRGREVNLAGGRLGGILSAADGNGAHLARSPSDEAMNRLLCDEKGDTTVGFLTKSTLQNEGVDELEKEICVNQCEDSFLLGVRK